MPSIRPIIVIGALISLLLPACGGADGSGGDAGGTFELTAPAGAATGGFAPTDLQVEADAGFTIHFVNDDTGVPHNVQIFEGATSTGEAVWAPADDAVITGPDEVDYDVPALAAGSYAYNCLTHPTTMVGVLTVA